MVNNVACRCENCGRTTEYIQVDVLTIDCHTAQLCLACAHVLSLPQQRERFLKLVRGKDIKQSNEEMQKAHRLLSGFIAVGTMFIVGIAVVVGVTQGFDITNVLPNPIDTVNGQDALTFLHLKSFN